MLMKYPMLVGCKVGAHARHRDARHRDRQIGEIEVGK